MKKIVCLIYCLIIMLCLSSCNKDEEKIKILAPSGIPAIALGPLFDVEEYEFTLTDGAPLLGANLIKEDYDIIVAPIILGAQLYNNGVSNYKLASIITCGNSYLVMRQEDKIDSLKDLVGKEIVSYGENTAPDIVLKAALAKEEVNIKDINILYEDSVSSAFSNRFISNDHVNYCLSAEPIISKMNNKMFKDKELFVIDLQEILKEEIEIIPQAGIFVKKGTNKNIEKFINDVIDNIFDLNSNSEEYVEKLFNLENNKDVFDSIGKEIIISSIPRSNIVYMDAYENKNILDDYFDMINKYNSNILNGEKVEEGIYYK